MGGSGSIWVTILPLVILLAVMYFLLIRPQKKREKEVNAMRSSVQVGDEIVTIGGICGKIVKTKEESLVIQVGADKVKFEIMRWAVSKVVEEGRRPAKTRTEEVEDIEEEEVEVKKAKPKRMKKAAPVEEEPEETEEVEAEEAEEVEEAEVEEAEAEETEAEEKEEK
ncbi:MAG: preprotein translocase subunit YajC [Bacillota bacterium]|nr:preprotein translocase subunit YajC [Bacillota bacterium]